MQIRNVYLVYVYNTNKSEDLMKYIRQILDIIIEVQTFIYSVLFNLSSDAIFSKKKTYLNMYTSNFIMDSLDID